MATQFAGKGSPLSPTGLSAVSGQLEVQAAEVWTVLHVETGGCGFLPDRRPDILFERHVFSRETRGRFDGQAPDISNPQPGGYGAGGAHQYDRLLKAIALDRPAALRSASWGVGQVMGFNAQIAGFGDVEAMVAAMAESEDKQLLAMAGEIKHNNLHLALKSHDWRAFARGYNGPNFERNQYDTQLAASFQRYRVLLPDLNVRATQLYLSYLGFEPGKVDGVPGSRTRSAIEEFQQQQGLPATGDVTPVLLDQLRTRVG
jgi:hypothetical protein